AAFAAILSIGALWAASAAAKPLKLQLNWEGESHQLMPGDDFKMITHQATVTTNDGTITCTEPAFPPGEGFAGEVGTSMETTDSVALNSSSGRSGGSESCPNPGALGAAGVIKLSPEGAKLRLSGSKGKAEIKALTPAETVYLNIEYSGGRFCTFTTTKMK